ncbi:hypothetical protein KI387_021967, partial [Taxus chinensis]
QLADAPLPDTQHPLAQFPDEYIQQIDFGLSPFKVKLFFDGSKCQQGGGAGFVMIPPWGTPIPVAHKLNFECTNNMAEYEALVLGLQNSINLGARHIELFGDSELIVNQVTGVYQCKNDILQKYRDIVLAQLQSFDNFTIQAIPRTANRFADTMASLASLIPPFTEDS